MLNVAIVGAGTMGHMHADCCREASGVDLVAVADAAEDRARAFAAKYAVKAYSDLTAVCKDPAVDIVAVCVPTPWHCETAITAATGGKHVFLEKPIARTLDQAGQIVDACERAGVKLFVGHVVRYFQEYCKVKELIDTGQIGRVVVVRALRGGPFPRTADDWYASREKSGGLIVDMLIHDYDWLRWCFGEVKRVYARDLLERNIPYVDYALVCLRFESRVIAHVTGSWAYPSNFRTSLEVAGDKGMIQMSSTDSAPISVELKTIEGGSGGGVAVPASPVAKSPYLLEWEEFVSWINGEREPRVCVNDAVEALRIALAAEESANTHQPVNVH
jgi:predicted dehydrogenase